MKHLPKWFHEYCARCFVPDMLHGKSLMRPMLDIEYHALYTNEPDATHCYKCGRELYTFSQMVNMVMK